MQRTSSSPRLRDASARGHGRACSVDDVVRYRKMLSSVTALARKHLTKGWDKAQMRARDVFRDYEDWGTFIPILNWEYWVDAVIRDWEDQH